MLWESQFGLLALLLHLLLLPLCGAAVIDNPLPIRLKEKFYIYEWWHICHKLHCWDKGNFGAGRLINATNGIYDTYQYDLFSLFYQRFFQDPRRTLNPEEATTFIISYDTHMDAMTYTKPDGQQERSFFDGTSDFAPEVAELLQASPYFQRNQGRDHLLVVGWPYSIDQLLLKPKAVPLYVLCENCTKLTIEDFSFLNDKRRESRTLAQQYKGNNWHAVPYPSNFHFAWQVKPPFLWERTHRPVLVSYIGSSSCFSKFSSGLRHELLRYCSLHMKECRHAHYSKHGPRHSDLAEGARDPHYIYSARSVFCLQPLGDTTTRKGLFDVIMFGCIPVVFHPLSASAMYTWHWSTELWKNVIIEIPINMAASNKPVFLSDPILYLKQLYEQEPRNIRERQRLLRRHAFELSYALEFMKPNSSWPLDERGEPLRDAYEITMDYVLGLHTGMMIERPKEWDPAWRGDLDRLLPAYYNNEFVAALETYERNQLTGSIFEHALNNNETL